MPARRHFARHDPQTLGLIALVAWGTLTAAEVAPVLGMHRATVARLSRALYGREPTRARAAFVRKWIARAEGVARRPLTKAQLRAVAEKHSNPNN